MKTFRQFLQERNLANKAAKDAWKQSTDPRAFRVDPSDRGDPWKKTRYKTGSWGSAPIKDGEKVTTNDKVTEPVAFATPNKPNPLYAFPRKDKTGKIVPAASVKPPGEGKGVIYTTKKGLNTLRQTPASIHSASAKAFDPIGKHMDYDDPNEIATSKNIEGAKTTKVKNPEAFVRSGYDIQVRTGKKSIKKAVRKAIWKSPKGTSITSQV